MIGPKSDLRGSRTPPPGHIHHCNYAFEALSKTLRCTYQYSGLFLLVILSRHLVDS
ncbi:hypothetical protein BJ165DRAFT_1467564 [Panaeolus papilionaceus]|nr:hypothetical protein BJ165DRAFT_1467564 [Panaeolus papilionaceus]